MRLAPSSARSSPRPPSFSVDRARRARASSSSSSSSRFISPARNLGVVVVRASEASATPAMPPSTPSSSFSSSETVKSWRVNKTGALSGMTLVEDDAIAPPGPGEARVHVKAIGLNFADVFRCVRELQTFFTRTSVSTFDRVPFQLTDEHFLSACSVCTRRRRRRRSSLAWSAAASSPRSGRRARISRKGRSSRT